MIIQEQRRLMSVEDFNTFVERPENADKQFELVGERFLKCHLMRMRRK